MKNKVTIPHIFLTIVLFVLCGCGIKLKGAKRGDGASVETFLVGNGIIQYFVKPLFFTGPKSKIFVDFTFRGNHDSLYKAKINFSVEGGETNKIDSYQLVNVATNNIVATVFNPSMTSTAKGHRYFSDADNKPLYDLFANGQNFKIIIYSPQTSQTFTPTAKSLKKIKKIPSILMSN